MIGDATLPRKPSQCLNCGATLHGRFCASCGQRDVPAFPTVREMAAEVATELWGWDGRIALTFRTLLFSPGKLTREFLEGRRARYLAPFRLYLIASVAYFVIAASAPDVRLDANRTLKLGFRFGVTQIDSAAANDPNPGRGGQPLTAEERAQLLAEIENAPAFLRPLWRKAIDDPAALNRAMFETLPKVFFVLLPFFAAIVSLFYRKRRFPQHLYFAIHLHAFVFFTLAFLKLLQFTQVGELVVIATFATIAAIAVYVELTFRAVYGGRWWTRLLKVGGIAALYTVGALAVSIPVLAFVWSQR